MSAVKVRNDIYWVGVQDPNLRVFDIVMHTKYGTSYNSFLLKTPKFKVLFETAKDKFFDTFMANLKEVCDPSELDFIVIDHTEPDHTGSLEKLLDYATKAEVLASPIAITFLKDICNREIPAQPVFDNQVIELDTCKLRFMSVPFLHWPDSIYTYIDGMDTLITCDSFGCHYADDKVCNDLMEGNFEPAYKYYFDMIMGPFKSHVRYALDRIKGMDIKTICPGHGPVLRENPEYYIDLYAKWSREPEPERREKPKVVNAFVSAYGYSEKLAQEINAGIKEEIDADIQLYDMVYADSGKVSAEMAGADGILVGSPTINGDALPPVLDLIMSMNGILHGGKVAGSYGSFGWSGEGPDMLMDRLNVLRMKTVEPPLKITFKPEGAKIGLARKYGRKFGRKLSEEWEKRRDNKTGKTYWKCTVCGEVFEGALPPPSCPVCGAGQEAFIEFVPEVVTFRNDKEMSVAIIGAGAAAVSAAAAVRKRNSKADIKIFSREKVFPYYRPVLTKAIAKKVTDAEYLIEPRHFFDDNNIDLMLDSEITRIDPENHTIELDNGETHTYGKLVVATGSRCFVPPIPGADLLEVIALREQHDFDRLQELIGKEKKRIVVIGGGLLGLETADSLAELKHDVTVLEACPIILPREMDDDGAALFERMIARDRVKVDLGVYVEEITGGEHVSGVKTKKNLHIPADIVIISAGIRSNIQLARDAEIKAERGILVNEKMQTNYPDIYACGDCAEFNGRIDGIWETAIEQGKIAGANIAGEERAYEPKVFGATLHAFGTKLFALGDLGADKETQYRQVISRDDVKETYKKLYFKHGKLVGGILLGDVSLTNPLLAGITRGFNVEDAADAKLL